MSNVALREIYSPGKKRRIEASEEGEQQHASTLFQPAHTASSISKMATLTQLRQLVRACSIRHEHDTAAFYAEKAVVLSDGQLDDVFALAQAYLSGSEYARGFAVLERYGVLDSSAATAAARSQGGEGASAELRFVHLAALCLKGMKAWDRMVLLLESHMEGRIAAASRPVGGLRCPLNPVPPAIAQRMARIMVAHGIEEPAAAQPTAPSYSDSSAMGGAMFAGSPLPVSAASLTSPAGPLRYGSSTTSTSSAQHAMPLPATTPAADTSSTNLSMAGMRMLAPSPTLSASPSGSPVGPSDGDGSMHGSNGSGGLAVWAAVHALALQHSEAIARAAGSAVSDFPLTPAVTAAATVTAFGGGSSTDASTALLPVPVGSGANINLVACLCLLRGEALLSLGNPLRAAQWFLAALRCDPYAVRAAQLLCDHHLLDDEEEAALAAYVDSVLGVPIHVPSSTPAATPAAAVANKENARTHAPPPAAAATTASAAVTVLDNSWLRELIACRLNRYRLVPTVVAKFSKLDSECGLGNSVDVLAARADGLLLQHDPAAAAALAKRVVAADPHHRRAAEVYYAALVQLRRSTDLYAAAHAAVKACPSEALSWYGVGCYYTAQGKHGAAGKNFSKATQLDPLYAPAWVGLGGALCAQEEVEPALQAYRTALRLRPNSHIPPLAMAHLAVRGGHTMLAKQYLDMATSRCSHDPLVYHEAGVLEYRLAATAGAGAPAAAMQPAAAAGYNAAWGLFNFAIGLLEHMPSHTRQAFEPTYVNLGHTLRKLGRYTEAANAYTEALALCPGTPSTLCALAYTHQLQGHHGEAVRLYHSVLSKAPDDGFAQRMLRVALQDELETAELRAAAAAAVAAATGVGVSIGGGGGGMSSGAASALVPPLQAAATPAAAAAAMAASSPITPGGMTFSSLSAISLRGMTVMQHRSLLAGSAGGGGGAGGSSSSHVGSGAGGNVLDGMSLLGTAPVLFEADSDAEDVQDEEEDAGAVVGGAGAGGGGGTGGARRRQSDEIDLAELQYGTEEDEDAMELGVEAGYLDDDEEADEEEDGAGGTATTTPAALGFAAPPAPHRYGATATAAAARAPHYLTPGSDFVRASSLLLAQVTPPTAGGAGGAAAAPPSAPSSRRVHPSAPGYASRARGVGTSPIRGEASAYATDDMEDAELSEMEIAAGHVSGASGASGGGVREDADVFDTSGDLDLAARLQAEELAAAYGMGGDGDGDGLGGVAEGFEYDFDLAEGAGEGLEGYEDGEEGDMEQGEDEEDQE